jgi:hypothetical protein
LKLAQQFLLLGGILFILQRDNDCFTWIDGPQPAQSILDAHDAFAPFDPFVPIETTDASALGGLDRLTVQDDHRRAGQAAAA